MRFLLDTHILVWWVAGSSRLGAAARRAILDSDADLYVSAATWWELAIKRALRRLDFDFVSTREALEARGVGFVSVTADHGEVAAALPLLHNDPFDRMLVAQASAEGLVLLTRDRALKAYGGHILVV